MKIGSVLSVMPTPSIWTRTASQIGTSAFGARAAAPRRPGARRSGGGGSAAAALAATSALRWCATLSDGRTAHDVGRSVGEALTQNDVANATQSSIGDGVRARDASASVPDESHGLASQ